MLVSPFQNNFRWFEGVVEDRIDPLELGRVRVRVFSLHTDNLEKIKTQDLHWMQVMHPTTSAANSGVSQTPKLIEGTHVIGFFRDGDFCQDGVVLGTTAGLPQTQRSITSGFGDNRKNLNNTPQEVESYSISSTGISHTNKIQTGYPRVLDVPDLSKATSGKRGLPSVYEAKRLSLKTNVPTVTGTFTEPKSPEAQKYPYNQVTETESGHLIELDDTPNNERIHIAHRSGSFVEYHSDGDVVTKSAKDTYDISHGNSNEYVSGEKNITVGGNANILVNAENGSSSLKIKVNAGGDMEVTIAGGNLTYNIHGDMIYNITGGLQYNVQNATQVNSVGDFVVKANSIWLN